MKIIDSKERGPLRCVVLDLAAERVGLLLLVLLLSFSIGVAGAAPVTLMRTPDGGIQPQAVIDGRGVIHLIYFKGEPGKGDIFYVQQQPGQGGFSKPVRVNSTPGSACAMGNIRGAQLALGRNGRVHVAWNGQVPANGTYMQAPMLYTRLNDAGTAFEPERDVITVARGLDGGGSVTADNAGNVYVFWHVPKPGGTNDEADAAVFMAKSTNDGKTFAPEKQASMQPTGACGCCGMKSFVDSAGDIFVMYRSASEMVNRNETLLVSRNHGQDFEVAYTHGWKMGSCPMSSAFLSETQAGVLAAAETHGRVYFLHVDPRTAHASEPVSPSVKGKYPVVVGNAQGEVLLAWAEGTSWGQGGSVAWQVYDRAGNATPEKGRAEGFPVWSLVAAVPKPDGSFAVIY